MELAKHLPFMKKAMDLAEKGRGFVSPNPVVGAVLVRKGKVIAEDWHRKFGEGHAERNLLAKEKGKRKKEKIQTSDVLYVTLEPCCHTNKKTKPCTEIILESGVKKLVVGLLDPNPEVSGKGVASLREAGIEVLVLEDDIRNQKSEIRNKLQIPNAKATTYNLSATTLQGLLEELQWQNRFFFKWVRERKPWVTLKIAQTLDGRIVRKRGESLWLTGEESREHVHQKRAEYDALLVGVKTIIADDSRLTVRDKNNVPLDRQPRTIVLDAALSIPITAAVVRPGTILFRGRQFQRRASRKLQLVEKGVEVLEVDTNEAGYLHLGQILDELAARGIASLYVEGGSSVWSSFLKEGFVDELMVYFAPKFLGDGVEVFELAEGRGQRKVKNIQFREMKVLGDDVYWQGSFLAV
ncbi:MAG: bifunctional diaminohydroxyphosphoribosylaminopyrimidine deaminase/5-amino-6-(5-phosphoribosylamino)uracil reductase RibD [Candidatus Altimarinota bacterium]